MKSQIRAVIVDDEEAARSLIRAYVKEYCPDVTVLGEAVGVQSGREMITASSPNLVFLDINMEDGSGFDLLNAFPNPSFRIIFITAYDKFAYRAFQYSAVDYLLKPIDPLELQAAVNKVFEKKEQDNYLYQLRTLVESMKQKKVEKIALSSSEGLSLLKLQEILRLESQGNYTTFYTANERIIVSRSLKEYEELLPEDRFFRIHQSHLVNLHYVRKVLKEDGGAVLMEDGSRLPLSRRKKDAFILKLTQGSL